MLDGKTVGATIEVNNDTKRLEYFLQRAKTTSLLFAVQLLVIVA